ncbi:MFS transporter [Aureitalea sp. L0-47]|uniref:POT-type proton-dependent oligopeptide transporter n=1 Tax=Aureitalea sp. L0-47 TaxID=2816962 RepID=UPI0022376D8A|nr:MFS transporter [Aureitalea sp. L0-47]MCW5520336.1 MFS transporter [Aureitalea sp. L0-47]
MEAITNQKGHNWTTFIHMTSRALERASYYGIRGLLVLYLTSEVFAMDHYQAIGIYGWLAGTIVGAEILGALLGDLILGNRIAAIIGAAIQAIGAFVLCLPMEFTVYAGIGLLGLGAGIYSPNLLSLFGKNYYYRKHSMDSGFTFLYFAINIGAFLGTLIIGLLGEESFVLGFILGGVLSLCAMISMFFSPKLDIKESKSLATSTFSTRVIWIGAAILISAFFWGLYEFGAGDMYVLGYDVGQSANTSSFLNRIWSSMNSGFVLIFALVFGFLWMVIKLNRVMKIGIGFICASLAYALVLIISPDGSGLNTALFIFGMILVGLAEIFVAPTILSLITKHSNPKYLAIILSIAYLPGRLMFRVVGLVTPFFMEFMGYPGLKIGLALYLIFGIVLIAFSGFVKENPDAAPSTESV